MRHAMTTSATEMAQRPDPTDQLKAAAAALAEIDRREAISVEKLADSVTAVSEVISGLQRSLDPIVHPQVLRPEHLYSEAAGARKSADDELATLREHIAVLRRAVRDAGKAANLCVRIAADLQPREWCTLNRAEAIFRAEEGHDVFVLSSHGPLDLSVDFGGEFFDDLDAACYEAEVLADTFTVGSKVEVWRVVAGDAAAPERPELRLATRAVPDADL